MISNFEFSESLRETARVHWRCLYKKSRGILLVVEAVWSCGKRGRGPVFQGLWEGPQELSIGRQIPQPGALRLSCRGRPGLFDTVEVSGDENFLVVPGVGGHQPVNELVALARQRDECGDMWFGVAGVFA